METPQPARFSARRHLGKLIEGGGPDTRILDHVAAAVYTCDAQGRITYFNESAAAMWGRRPELLTDLWCGSWKIYGEDGDPLPLDQWPVAIALREGRAIRRMEIMVERPDGIRRRVVAYPEPIYDSYGDLIGALNLLVDVTDLRDAAERAQAQTEELTESEARKDEFIATLAHELRNPLTPLGIAAQMLHNIRFRDPAGSGIVITLERQVQNLTRLVDDLLENSRISQGRIVLRKTDSELKAIIDNAVEIARPHMEQAGHELKVSLAAAAAAGSHLHVDATRVAQIIGNLLNNAAKFTPDGGRIELRVRMESGRLVVIVKDNGIGITTEQLPYVFDLYSHGGRSRHEMQGGMGIGLSVAKKLAELHGGTLRAASEGEGQGAELTLVIPCEPQSSKPLDQDPDTGDPAAVGSQETTLRILVADDNHGAADIMAIAMRSMGANVRVVYDGKAAVEAVGSFRPAMVFMDIGMTGVDGHEAARQIRADPANQDLVLIAVSGWGQDDIRQQSLDAGFNHHVVKPMGLEQLRKLVRDYADKAH